MNGPKPRRQRQRAALMSNALSHLCRRTGFRVAFSLTLGGCAAAPKASGGAAPSAHVTVVNLTDYRWQLDIVPEKGTRHFIERLEPRQTANLDVPGGNYQIDQSILTETDRPNPPRHFTAQLVAGQTYHWPLATLQSDAADDTAEKTPGG